MPERSGIVTRAGHICMICGFLPMTKNKYRELQDHLVRKHFNDRIKAVLPVRRPYMCPEPSCNIEGKDWQALMRHYTGKHGVLERFLKEVIDNGLTLPENPKHAKRRQRQQRQKQREAEKRKKETCASITTGVPFKPVQTCTGQQIVIAEAPPVVVAQSQPPQRKRQNSTGSASSPESLEEEEMQSTCTTGEQPQAPQLALVLKRSKSNEEDSYALVDIKCLLGSSPDPDIAMCMPQVQTQSEREQMILQELAQQQPVTVMQHTPVEIANTQMPSDYGIVMQQQVDSNVLALNFQEQAPMLPIYVNHVPIVDGASNYLCDGSENDRVVVQEVQAYPIEVTAEQNRNQMSQEPADSSSKQEETIKASLSEMKELDFAMF